MSHRPLGLFDQKIRQCTLQTLGDRLVVSIASCRGLEHGAGATEARRIPGCERLVPGETSVAGRSKRDETNRRAASDRQSSRQVCPDGHWSFQVGASRVCPGSVPRGRFVPATRIRPLVKRGGFDGSQLRTASPAKCAVAGANDARTRQAPDRLARIEGLVVLRNDQWQVARPAGFEPTTLRRA